MLILITTPGQMTLHPLQRILCKLSRCKHFPEYTNSFFRAELVQLLGERESLLRHIVGSKPATFQLAVECFIHLVTELLNPKTKLEVQKELSCWPQTNTCTHLLAQDSPIIN